MAEAPSAGAAGAYSVAAGLNLLSGVFGYMASMNAASAANSRADLIRMEAEANAQRYSEEAQAHIAQQKMMFVASGVKLAGSPIDVLATSARIASENIDAIRMAGARGELDQRQVGEESLAKGRNALLGGVGSGVSDATKAYGAMPSAGGSTGYNGMSGASAWASGAWSGNPLDLGR